MSITYGGTVSRHETWGGGYESPHQILAHSDLVRREHHGSVFMSSSYGVLLEPTQTRRSFVTGETFKIVGGQMFSPVGHCGY